MTRVINLRNICFEKLETGHFGEIIYERVCLEMRRKLNAEFLNAPTLRWHAQELQPGGESKKPRLEDTQQKHGVSAISKCDKFCWKVGCDENWNWTNGFEIMTFTDTIRSCFNTGGMKVWLQWIKGEMGKEKERANIRFCCKMEHTNGTLSSWRGI